MNALPPAACLLCLLSAAPLAAQTTTTPPQLVVETVGPDGWRTRLGPTNLGSLLASQQGRELWQPFVQPLLDGWQELVGGPTFAAQRARVLGYGGRIRAAVWLDAGDRRANDDPGAVLVLEPDDRTDMAALAGDLAAFQDTAAGVWQQEEVDGETVVVRREGRRVMTKAALRDGKVFVALDSSDRLAAIVAAARWFVDAAGGKAAPTSPALLVDLDIAQLLAAARRDGDDDGLIELLGVDSLARLQVGIGTAGPHVQLELRQQFADGPKGLFAAFFPPVAGIPGLQRAVPATAGSWRVGRFGFRALFDTLLALAASRQLPGAENVRDDLRRELGVDVGDDVIAHMTDEVLAFGSPLEAIDRPDDFTWAVAVALRDEKAFDRSLATMLRKAKPHLTRAATTTIHGVECHRYGNALRYDLWFAVGRGVFLCAGGRDAEERLTWLLAGLAAAPPAADGTGPAETALADVRRFLPPGMNAAARGDLDAMLGLPVALFDALRHGPLSIFGLDPLPEDTPEQIEHLRALLKAHQLDVLRTATGHERGSWRWRLYW
jgi:hypothetical protein